MTFDFRVAGLEWVLNELDMRGASSGERARTISKLADTYARHCEAYVTKEGTVGYIAANMKARRHLQPVIYVLNEMHKRVQDEDDD